MLPPEVMQAYGISFPPPIDDSLAGAPMPDPQQGYGGLHPAVAQAFRFAPPPARATAAPPMAPDMPQSLPSMAPPSAPQHGIDAPTSPSKGDYAVPPQALAAGAPKPPAAPSPQRMPGSIQLGTEARQKEQLAEQQQAGAVREQEALSAAGANQDLEGFKQHEARAQQVEADRKAWNDEYAKTRAQKQAYVDATLNDVDNYKIDQNKFMHEQGIGDMIGWGIATALSAVGDAMRGVNGPNPVVQMMQQKMHQAVQAQMDERDRLRDKSNRAEHSLDKYDSFAKDRQSQIDLLDARNDKWLAGQIALTKAKMAPGEAHVAADKAIGELMQSSADKAGQAAERASNHEMQAKQVAIAGGHLALAQRTENRAQRLQDLEYGPGGFKEQELGLKAAEEMRKAMADQKKKIADEGVHNPATGDPLLTANGRAMMQQADRIEATARTNPADAAMAYVQRLKDQATTPQGKAQVAQLEQHVRSDPKAAAQLAQDYAGQLRDTARTTEIATLSDKEDRRKVSDALAHAQTLINSTAKIKEFLKSDPSITDREGWGRLQAEYGTAMVDYAKSIGANASSRELDAISEHIMSYDPNSIKDRLYGKTPAIGALQGLDDAVKGGVDSMLRSKGIKDGWTPASPLDQPATQFSGQTSQEAGAAAEPGLYDKANNAIADDAYALTHPGALDAYKRKDPKQVAEDAAPAGDTGLAPQDDAAVKSLVKRAESGSNAERARVVEQLAAPIIANSRPTLSWGLLRLVQANDPSLYEDVLARLPPMQADEIRQIGSAPSRQIGADIPATRPR